MFVSRYDAQNILQDFPEIKLSYVKTLHKKVTRIADIYIAIPMGKKYFIWFRFYKNKPNCFILEIDSYKRGIKAIFRKTCCFDDSLCAGLGTICYGTLLKHEDTKTPLFGIEDIYYLRGNDLRKINLYKKIANIEDMFKKHIKQVLYHKDGIIVGVPIISTSRKGIMDKLNSINYSIYAIQLRYYKGNQYFLNELYSGKIYKRCFVVRAEITYDIYSLYVLENKTDKRLLHCVAIIPDYKTSVMMNEIFRDIKENKNLDLLEESDDDEEFENIKDTKYIKNKEFIMECVYMNEYKSWKPLGIAGSKDISLKDDIIRIEKNNKH
tara:strand:+ start:1352 stop:2320 length:969 start_codon:yes stop_codon:yes gene_type:complete